MYNWYKQFDLFIKRKGGDDMVVDKNKVYVAMARACMTTKLLAEGSQITTQALNNILKGRQKSKPATIGRIAQVLGVDVVEILKAQ